MALLLAYPELAVALALIVSAAAVLLQHHSSGWISWFQKFVENVPLFAGLFSLEQVIQLDRWVTNKLGHVRESVEHVGVKWLAALSFYVYVMGYWSTYWPVALKNTVEHLIHRTIPRAINARTKPIQKRIDVAEAQAKAAAGTAHTTVKYVTHAPTTKAVTQIERVAMPHAKEWEWLHKHWKAVTAAVLGAAALPTTAAIDHPATLPVPFGQTVKQIRRRLHRVEALLGVTAFAAVLSQVLGVRVSCLKPGGNIGKTARRLCGLPTHWLNDVLGLLADFYVLENLCDVLPWVESAASAVAVPFVDAVTTISSANKGCLSKTAPTYTVPQLYLPSVASSGLTAGV